MTFVELPGTAPGNILGYIVLCLAFLEVVVLKGRCWFIRDLAVVWFRVGAKDGRGK